MLKKLLYPLYEPMLRRDLEDVEINHILLVISASDIRDQAGISKLRQFIEWSFDLSIPDVCIYISTRENGGGMPATLTTTIYNELESIDAKLAVYTHQTSRVKKNGDERYSVNVSIGLGGRDELVYATRKIMEEVKAGHITPEEIDEKLIESKLIFNFTPDLIIRSGTTKLTDFLIWQAVYSELYFTDVSWVNFRKIDFLRAIRDFKKRERRFGR